MPPTLDLSGTTHSKMIMAPPRINLRRAASYNHADKGPLSSTSSRFSFNHLVFASPPPSPRLPTLVPRRPRKPSNAPRPSRVLRAAIWAFGTFLVMYAATSTIQRYQVVPMLVSLSRSGADKYEMVAQDELPDFPTPIIINDKGRARWTVSIPPYYDFPLTTREYTDMSAKCLEVSARVKEMRHPGRGLQGLQGLHGLPQNTLFRHEGPSDEHFLDVQEAEKAGFLPSLTGSVRLSSLDHGLGGMGGHDAGLVGENKDSLVDRPVCGRTLTFVLESADAGLGKTLMMLWTAYGIAQRQGRSFFVDDSRWAYGSYTGIFQPPPSPGCRSPRRHEMLPCPHSARHLVLTAEAADGFFTASLGLGHGASPSPSVPGQPLGQAPGQGSAGHPDTGQQKSRFDLAREGYEAMFRLNSQDDQYVSRRAEELFAKSQPSVEGEDDGVVIGVHVRRGDRHPIEFQYRDSYMPFNHYTERARRTLDLTYSSKTPGRKPPLGKERSLLVLASDDPMVYESVEFARAARAQEQIKLASKAAIQKVNPDRTVMHKFVDETFGWEGGFFAAMFWNLGLSSMSSSNAAKSAETKLSPSSETLRLRSLVGRAYMMDLAVLARASDVVICTVSAMGCRLLAVMMGWEKAIGSGYWVNIDGDYGWDGNFW